MVLASETAFSSTFLSVPSTIPSLLLIYKALCCHPLSSYSVKYKVSCFTNRSTLLSWVRPISEIGC